MSQHLYEYILEAVKLWKYYTQQNTLNHIISVVLLSVGVRFKWVFYIQCRLFVYPNITYINF